MLARTCSIIAVMLLFALSAEGEIACAPFMNRERVLRAMARAVATLDKSFNSRVHNRQRIGFRIEWETEEAKRKKLKIFYLLDDVVAQPHCAVHDAETPDAVSNPCALLRKSDLLLHHGACIDLT